jgi:hypothetical protein
MGSTREALPEGEGLSTVDLLVLTSLDQLIFVSKMVFYFFAKRATLTRRLAVLNLPSQLVFPGSTMRSMLRNFRSLFTTTI